jgi:hypothetical protein
VFILLVVLHLHPTPILGNCQFGQSGVVLGFPGNLELALVVQAQMTCLLSERNIVQSLTVVIATAVIASARVGYPLWHHHQPPLDG